MARVLASEKTRNGLKDRLLSDPGGRYFHRQSRVTLYGAGCLLEKEFHCWQQPGGCPPDVLGAQASLAIERKV
jgi:hypothetical protein